MHNAERFCLDFSDDFSGESQSQGSLQCGVMLCPQILEVDFQSRDTSFPNRLVCLKGSLSIS